MILTEKLLIKISFFILSNELSSNKKVLKLYKYLQCKPWQSRACCEDNTTLAFHLNKVWLGFNMDHCPGHNLSDACRNWFLQDLCFYECSPNTGPWITEVYLLYIHVFCFNFYVTKISEVHITKCLTC